MSLFSAINIALSGLQATSKQLSIVSDNISNASTAGYTKKTATVQSVSLGSDVGGSIVSGYTRATDNATTLALTASTSNYNFLNTQNNYLQQVQQILGSTNSTPALSTAISNFAQQFRTLASSPESLVQQQQVIDAGKQLATQINSLATQVRALDTQASTDIKSTLSDLNTDLQAVGKLNNQIVQERGAGNPSGNLEDQRDQLVQKIAAITQVNVQERSNGSVSLFTPQGYQLIDGNSVKTFQYSAISGQGSNLHVVATSDPSTSLDNVLSGGSLQAAVNFRLDNSPATASTDSGTEVIRKLSSQLDAVAAAFTSYSAGPPKTFAYAYNPPDSLGATDHTKDLFTGTDRNTFAVNSAIVAGTTSLITSTASSAGDTFNDTSKTFTADGLSLTNSSYETLGTAILSNFQQAASNSKTQLSPAKTENDFLSQKLANNTGVNTDTELVSLTALQNSYNASAKVIATINAMFTALEAIT